MGDFTLVGIDREGAISKYKRANLWADYAHGTILPMAGRA